MSLFDKLSNLVKKEQTEEDKLIVDLQEAVKYLSDALAMICDSKNIRIQVIDPLSDTYKGKIKFAGLIKTVISWLSEAEKRTSVIINNLEQQMQVTDYRKKIELKESQQELLTFLISLELSTKIYIGYLKTVLNRKEPTTPDSPFKRSPQEVLNELRFHFRYSIKQLKAIKKKQNH